MVVHYTNSVSAHQIPLAREVRRLVGGQNFLYVYTNEKLQGGAQEIAVRESWVEKYERRHDGLLETCDVLIVGGLRPIGLMERRLKNGLTTLYMTERWFKPIGIGVGNRCRCSVPGWVRLFHPGYFRMARRFARLFRYNRYRFLPIGPWAMRDMRIIARLAGVRMDDDACMPWGDFVSASSGNGPCGSASGHESGKVVRVLWAGRLLHWKRVDTIIRAIAMANRQQAGTSYQLTIVGSGGEKPALQRMAARLSRKDEPFAYAFQDPVSLDQMRVLMREHDIYVLASNAQEGWGAVVPEAMSEGMVVLGTYEAGASAALLPSSHLFHAGDYKTLSLLLQTVRDYTPLPYGYTPRGAAERLLKEFS